VSLGGQSFDDLRLAALGRRHRRQDLLEACHWLQESLQVGGLQSWSLDLIRNLPDQGDEEWAAQLDQGTSCVDLRPQRGARHGVCLARETW
jgi:oxygen-independent coproporphyrinogen-3 oxidase